MADLQSMVRVCEPHRSQHTDELGVWQRQQGRAEVLDLLEDGGGLNDGRVDRDEGMRNVVLAVAVERAVDCLRLAEGERGPVLRGPPILLAVAGGAVGDRRHRLRQRDLLLGGHDAGCHLDVEVALVIVGDVLANEQAAQHDQPTHLANRELRLGVALGQESAHLGEHLARVAVHLVHKEVGLLPLAERVAGAEGHQ